MHHYYNYPLTGCGQPYTPIVGQRNPCYYRLRYLKHCKT